MQIKWSVKTQGVLKLLVAGHNPEQTTVFTLYLSVQTASPPPSPPHTHRSEATVLIEFPIAFQLSKMYANSFKENNLNFVPGFLSG